MRINPRLTRVRESGSFRRAVQLCNSALFYLISESLGNANLCDRALYNSIKIIVGPSKNFYNFSVFFLDISNTCIRRISYNLKRTLSIVVKED